MCNDTREDLLHRADHVLGAADWSGNTLVDIGYQPRCTHEKQQYLVKTVEVFLQRRDEDHQIVRVQGGTVIDSLS
jgi:hypothetical protein